VIFRLCKLGVFADYRDQDIPYNIYLMSIQQTACDRLSRPGGGGERCVPVLLIVILFRTGCAFADEPDATQVSGQESFARSPAPGAAVASVTARWPETELSVADISSKFQLPSDYSPHEYRPLGPSSVRREPRAPSLDARPALRASTPWDRLADYKARGGIRLLTLWNSKFSSLSLQTGHGGVPSLQWTSRGFGGGGGGETHGLLDRVLSSGIDRFEVFKHVLRPANPSSADRPADRRDN
jgi:hypothetical protein